MSREMSREMRRSAAVIRWCAATALVVVALVASGGAGYAAPVTVSSTRLGAASVAVAVTTRASTAVADTFANQASPNTRSGSSSTMTVRSAVGGNRRAFVRFDLSAIPSTARVQSATLRLTMSSAPAVSRTYEVDRVSASWSEATLTWNTMPPASSASATTASGTTSNTNLTWMVTADVKTFVANGAANFGWQIKDTSESSTLAYTATFRTREYSGVAQRPTLTVIYAT
jgi:hypothetical protein